MLPLAHCVGRGLDSQAPSTSNKTTHLHNHHTIAGGVENLLHRSVTKQGARSGGARRHAVPAAQGEIDTQPTALEAREEATAPLSITLETRLGERVEVHRFPPLSSPPSTLPPPDLE